MHQFRLNVLIAYTTGRCLGKYDKRGGKGEGSKRRKDATLDAVPRDRQPSDFLRYDDGVPRRSIGKYYREMLRREAPAAFDGRGEYLSGKPCSTRKHKELRGKLRSADAATCLHDLLSRSRLCPGEESVGRCALFLLRLIGSFGSHDKLGYTHDSTSFSPNRHWCLVSVRSVYSRNYG